MAFKTEFSKLGQLFYDEAGSEGKEVSLPGFIRDAYLSYQQRFIHPGLVTEGVRRVEYASDDRTNHLSIDVVTSHRRPEITGVAMNGRSEDISSLFSLFRGTVHAEFSGIKLKDITETFNIDPEQVKSRGYTLSRSLGLYFSRQGDDYILQRARPEKKVSRRLIFTRYVPVPLAEARLDEAARHLLSKAEHLTIINSSRVREDIDRNVVHESCSITHPGSGEYYWDYFLHTANNEGIPAEMLPALEALFSQIKSKFSVKAFQNLTISNHRQVQFARLPEK